MAIWTEELNSNYNFPNISIYNHLKDGVLMGYNAYPQEGYVMYDTNDNNLEPDSTTGELVPVTYYYTTAGFFLNYNFDNFSWVAIPRNEVDENYIN